MRHLRANSFMADRGARLGGTHACPPPPPGGQVRTAPVVTPPATGAGDFLQDGEAASRLVHTQEIAGASPAPATISEEEVAEVADPLLGKPLAAHGSDEVAVFSSVRQTRPGRSAPAVRASDESTAVIPQAVTAAETAPAATPCPAGAVTLSSHAMILLRAVVAYERMDNAQAVTLALAHYVKKIGAGPLARAVLDQIECENTHALVERVSGGEGNPSLPAGCRERDELLAVPEFRRVGENRFRGGGP